MKYQMGQSYGHYAKWCFHEKPDEETGYSWKNILRQEAAEQMKHLVRLRTSRPFFSLKPRRECRSVIQQAWQDRHVQLKMAISFLYVYSP